MKRALFVSVLLALGLHALVSAQQVGPNVNVVAGTDPRTGDPFLQRQNEAVVAVSTRNADHLIVAMNDYRTVDMAFDPVMEEEGPNGFIARRGTRENPAAPRSAESMRAATPPEAWVGLGFSRDRGRTWYTALLPGYPQDPSAVGKASPLYGDSAGSDPVLLTGENGRAYLIALTFDRGGISRISSTRYTDRNNVEGGEPFYFDFTRQIDRGSMSSKGVFADKPSAAAHAGGGATVFSTSGVSKKKKQVLVVPGCERLYVAYTVFDGNDVNGNFRSSVYTSVSASCGEAWSNPIKVSGPYTVNGNNYPGSRNQGTATAVDPDTGYVYIVWRTYGPNGFVWVRSTDGGLTYSTPKPLTASPIYLFDQPLLTRDDGTNVFTFRSNAYPSLVVYDGKLLATWSERVDLSTGQPAATGSPRAVMTIGALNSDGSMTWSPRHAIDMKDPGVAAANKRCEQQVPESGPPAETVCRATGAQVMPFISARDGQVAVVYYEARDDAEAPGGIAPGTGYISGMARQVDVRAALIDPTTWATITSAQISRYPTDPSTGRTMENPHAPVPALKRRVNYANYPMYRGGLAAFIGDYLGGVPIKPDGSGPGFRFVFTSNEAVEPPPDLDFTKYNLPQQGTLGSCNPGSRNSTIMTAEVGTGLVVGSPGTFKQLLDAQGVPVQRAFAVYVENHTPGYRGFRLSFSNVSGVTASFDQFASVPTVDIEVLASSSITRTVYLTGAVATGSAVVNVHEIQLPGFGGLQPATSLGQFASLTLNGDPTNPFVGGADGNPNLANTETHTPQLESPQLGSPQLGSPQIGSPQLGSPQLGSPQLGSPQLGSPQISSPQLGSTGPTDPYYTDITFKVTNEGNTASGFNSLISLANAPHLQQSGHWFQVIVYRVHQSATVNGCNIGKAQQDQVIYTTPQLGSPQLGSPQLGSPQIGSPQLGSPQLGSPQLGSPQLGSPQLGSPQLASASFSIAPGDPTPNDHDGTEHQHQEDDSLMLTVRVHHPENENVATAHPDLQAEFGNAIAVAVQAQAANTGETTPDGAFVDSIAPDTAILTSPASPNPNASATLAFAASDNLSAPADLIFECSLDAGPFAPCTSPVTYTGLTAGAHTFAVRARDQAGNADPTPASATWTYVPPTVGITSTNPAPNAAAGFGQLITIVTTGAPPETMPAAVFTQGTTAAQGFVFAAASKQNEYFVRLPFPNDNVQDGNPNDGMTPGPAAVRLVFNATTITPDVALTVTTTPGTPQARFVLGLSSPPNPDNQCGTLTSTTPVSRILAGQGIAIAAYGIDTTGVRAVFTQGTTVTEVGPAPCVFSSSEYGVAAVFLAPATLTPGPVTIQVKATVNEVPSAASNALSLQVGSNADLVVANGTALQRYAPDGTFISTIGTIDGCAQAFDIASNGDYVIADACNAAVWRMTPGGTATMIWSGEPLANPVAIAIDAQSNLVVGDNQTDALYRIALGVEPSITTLASLPGPSPNELQDIDIRRSPLGTLIVAYDSHNGVSGQSAVLSVTPGGAITTIVSGAAAPFGVGGLTINANGNFVIADYLGRRLVQVTPGGAVSTLLTDATALCCNMVGLDGDSDAGGVVSTINGVNDTAPRLVVSYVSSGVTTLHTGTPLSDPNYVRLLVVPGPPPAGASGTLDFNDQQSTFAIWNQNISRAFELKIDLGAKTTSLSIDGHAVAGAQNAPFYAPSAANISVVQIQLGTTGTQVLGWDDVSVKNGSAIFDGNFNADTAGAAPGPPALGSWSLANENGSVLVRAAVGDLTAKPVELAQLGGTNSVSLSGTVTGTPPTTGVWYVRWRAVMANPGSDPVFAYVVVRDNATNILASVGFRP